MHEKFAERFHAVLPPAILEAEKAKEQEESGQPPQLDPQQQMAQQAQEAQMQAGAAEMQAKVGESQEKARKAKAEADKAEADAETARVETLLAKQKLGKGEIDAAKEIDEHAAELARGHQRHQFDIARDADNHFTALERGAAEAERSDEQHQAKIRQMEQPKEAAPA